MSLAKASFEHITVNREVNGGDVMSSGYRAMLNPSRSSWVQKRVIHREPLSGRRRQQGIIGSNKDRRREAALLNSSPYTHRARQLEGIVCAQGMMLR